MHSGGARVAQHGRANAGACCGLCLRVRRPKDSVHTRVWRTQAVVQHGRARAGEAVAVGFAWSDRRQKL